MQRIESTPNNSAFATLMKYVSRNKTIPSKLQNSFDKDAALTLKDAIDKGDFDNPIFSHDECQLFLIYLLKENKIDGERFLTCYLYLTALMQFSQKQALHPKHEETRRLNWGAGKVLMIDAKDPILEEYVNNISKSLPVFNKKDILEHYRSLSSSERCLLAIPFDMNSSQEGPVEGMMRSLNRFSPFLQIIKYNNINYYFLPSIGLVNWTLKQINSERQMKISPIFGRISIDTLCNDFHRKGMHPVTLHSKYITSNPDVIHRKTAGPLPFALHDLFAHITSGTAFSEMHYSFLFDYIIPKLEELYNSDKIDDTTKTFVASIRYRVNDLAFNVERYAKIWDMHTRLEEYLNKAFDSNNCADLFVLPEKDRERFSQKICRIFLHFSKLLANDRQMLKSHYDIEVERLLNGMVDFYFGYCTNDIKDISLDTVINILQEKNLISLPLNQVLIEAAKYPKLVVAINLSGYKFLPPVFGASDQLESELSKRISELKENRTSTNQLVVEDGFFSGNSSIQHPSGNIDNNHDNYQRGFG